MITENRRQRTEKSVQGNILTVRKERTAPLVGFIWTTTGHVICLHCATIYPFLFSKNSNNTE